MKTFTTCAEKKAKQILNLLQGYTKGIRTTAILILLLMGVGNAWGKTVNGPRIYFDNSSMNMTSTQVYFVVGHNTFSRTYGPMTAINDTKLLYRDISTETYYNWGDATYVGFIQVGSKWGDGSWGSSNLKNATNYTAANTSWNSFDWQNTYYCKATSKGGTLTINYISSGYNGIQKYNATQSAKVRNTTSESYSTVNGNWPATLKLKGTYLSGDGASGRSEISSTKSSDGNDKRVYGAVVTGKITHSYSNLSEDYQFDGWGTSTPAAGNTYEYHITAATTVYAFFTKKYAVNFGVHSSGGGSISAKAGSETITSSGNKVVGGTSISFTATPKTGYQIEGWYSNSDCTSKITEAGTSTTYNAGTLSAAKTVYVKFKENTYTVTINNDGHGTTTPSGAQSNVGQVTGVGISATANNGYQFKNWTITSGSGSFTSTTATTTTFKPTAASTIQANFSIINYNITYNNLNGVTHANPTTYTIEDTPLTFTNPSERTGYTFNGWSPASIAQGSTGDKTVTALWTANTYTVTLDNQGATTAGAASVTATYNAAMPSIANNLPKKTGYTFNGYFDAESGGNQYYKDDGTSARTWNKTSNTTLYAQWTINSHEVTWKANGGNWSGSTADKVVTYNYGATIAEQAAPTRVGYEFAGWSPAFVANTTMPDNALTYTAQWTANQYTITLDKQGGTGGTSEVAVHYDNNDYSVNPVSVPSIQGYAFMGYYVAENGSGFQVVDATGNWVKSAHGYTDASGNWEKASDITLYAFFKKAEITSITLDKRLFESGETGYVTVTNHTIEPTPAGTVVVCWTLCYNNGTPVEGHDAIKEDDGTVKFAIDGLSTGTYKVKASLRLNDCNGEELDTAEATFVVAGSYTVTIKYTCDGDEIAGRKTQKGYPSTPTEATAPEIGGYNFVAWVLGDGIYTTDELTSDTIEYTANYDGYLTATYEKKKLIFLDISTLPSKDKWSAPHVYLYSSNDYWDGTKGIGATKSQCVAKAAMVQVPTATDIWYYEYEGVLNFNGFVAFTATDKKSQEYFYDTEVIYRGDFSKGTPVFVPAEGQNAVSRNSSAGKDAKYYSKGHWTKYMGGTGYTLKIYNHKEVDGRKELMSVPFTGSSLYLPFTAIVDLEGGQTFGYKIVRDDDKWYKNDNDGTMTVNSHTNWPFIEDKNNGLACGIQTVAAGNHTFTLTLNATSGNFEVSVDYPVTVGDYRILYKDTTRTTYKPSDIKKAEELNPVTSFFIRPNSNPELKIQTAARVSNEGVTWYADNHIYFKPNANWKQNDAYFAARFNGTEEVWSVLNQNGDVYSCKIPNGANDVIFVRMNPNGSDATNNKLNWNNKWNQTGHLSLPKDKNEYTLNEGEWGNKLYLKPNSNWFQKDESLPPAYP